MALWRVCWYQLNVHLMLDKVCISPFPSSLSRLLYHPSFPSLHPPSLSLPLPPPPPSLSPAISYECIRTVASVYPNNSVVAKTAKSLSRFVTSTNNNWRYLGITGLALLVQVYTCTCTYTCTWMHTVCMCLCGGMKYRDMKPQLFCCNMYYLLVHCIYMTCSMYIHCT